MQQQQILVREQTFTSPMQEHELLIAREQESSMILLVGQSQMLILALHSCSSNQLQTRAA
jgi:hypothetical protein